MIRTTCFYLSCFVLFAIAYSVGGDLANGAKPNFILCMADDQGWGDVGYRGTSPVKTPVLDEMAAGGLRFDRFYAAAPVCSPTRGSVMTGRHPNRFGCFRWGYPLRPQEITVAEALKQVGYTTGHFGKWHIGPVHAGSPANPGNSGFDRWVSAPNYYENDTLLSDQGKVIQTEGESSQIAVDLALGFIRNALAADQPFLAVVWFGSPHWPHIAVEQDRGLYPDASKKQQHFLGEITGIDRAMGKLREKLRELEIAENTLLWYCSDNGALPQGSTGGLRGKKGEIYEGGLRVPAMIEWPAKVKVPRTIMANTGTVDIYPTLLEIASVQIDNQPRLDGESLAGLIAGESFQRSNPLAFWSYPAHGRSTPGDNILAQMLKEQQASGKPVDWTSKDDDFSSLPQRNPEEHPGHAAWLDGTYKLHRIVKKSKKEIGAREVIELYDLESDPKESTNIAAQHPDRVKHMKAALSAWQTGVVESLNGTDYQGSSAEQSSRGR